jgi:hypothetical protein
MRAIERSIAIAVLLLACGCGNHLRELSADKPFSETNDDGIIVLRVTPGAWVELARGRVRRDGWYERGVSNRRQFWPEDGYVVAKVTPTDENEGFGIVKIQPEKFTNIADEAPFTYATAMWPQVTLSPFMPVVPGLIAQALAGPAYHPKANVRLPVFKAVAGKVTYVGAIRVDASKDLQSSDPPEKIAITPITSPADTVAVARFMAKHYPNVHAPIRTDAFQMMRRDEYTD